MNRHLDTHNYLHIPGFIPARRAHGLAEQFMHYVATFPTETDPQAPSSPSVYNFLPFTRLLVEQVPHMSNLVQTELLPTYAYARQYVNGEVLTRHRDRPACEISVTVNLHCDVLWPIWFQRPDGSETSVELFPGDAVIYKGCDADHWRDSFSGNICTQLFMHYVQSYGPNSWAVFDKRGPN